MELAADAGLSEVAVFFPLVVVEAVGAPDVILPSGVQVGATVEAAGNEAAFVSV